MIIELTGVEPFVMDGVRCVQEEDTSPIHIDLSKVRLADPLTVLGTALIAQRTAAGGSAPRVTLPEDDAEIDNMRTLGLFEWLDPEWVEGSPPHRHAARAGDGPYSLTAPNCLRLCRVDLQGDRRSDDFVAHCTELVDSRKDRLLRRAVGQVLAELIDNAVVHARSPVGTFAVAQLYASGEVEGRGVEVAVGDAGVGMVRTLGAQYLGLTRPVHALREAFKPAVSEAPPGDGRHSGLGLTVVHERVHRRIPHGELTMLSGDAFARLRAGEPMDRYGQRSDCPVVQAQFGRWGTWARLRIPLEA